jgi:hypothetical protein
MPPPDLVIPLRIDSSAADAALKKLAAGGHAAGVEIDKGMKQAQGGVSGATDAIGALLKAQMGLGLIKSVGGAIGSEFERAAEYTKKLAENFVALQKTMQSVAALSGKENTAKFTLSEAQSAGRANVTPQQYRDFRDKFLSRASTYIGAGPEAKLSEDDAQKFQEAMAEFAQQKGVAQSDMADFAGGLLAQKKGKTSAKDLMAEVGQAYSGIEAASADPAHLMPAMTRVMAQGFTAKEAAASLAQMPEIAPQEEGTHLLDVMKEIRKTTLSGKGEEFGMKEGMSPKEQLDALVKNLAETSGGDRKKLNARIAEFTQEGIAGETLAGLALQGPEATEKWKKLVNETPEDKIQQVIASGRKTDIGQRYAAESRVAVAEAERGALGAPVETERLHARADLVQSGNLESGDATKLARGTIGFFSGQYAEDQKINTQTLERLRTRAASLGITGDSYGQFQAGANGRIDAGDVMWRGKEDVSNEIKELLAAIEKSNARIADAMEKDKDKDKGGKQPAPLPLVLMPESKR